MRLLPAVCILIASSLWAGDVGSSYVPFDSWAYYGFERLAALGYIPSVGLSMRPWTRLECARLVAEAAHHGAGHDNSQEAGQLYNALSAEFARDTDVMNGERNRSLQLESGYARFLGITGTPLSDNYHFGQTLLNDLGRPYQGGFNAVDGASGWAAAGPFVLYVRGEYQFAPSAPVPSAAELKFFGHDQWPNGPAPPIASTNRFKVLDTYIAVNLLNWQFAFGRRSLWWGPSEGGTMIFSDNAAPLNSMFTLDRITPYYLPWLFRHLGGIRFQAFIGHMTGLQFQSTLNTGTTSPVVLGQYGKNLHPQPYLSGGKISFKLTPNFEFGMSKTTVYGGPGNPVTIKTLIKSTLGMHVNGDVLGDGRSEADFSYRIPGIRDWVTLYAEALSEDEISPIPYMRKSASQGGLYFPKVPKIPRLDLRLEGGYTDPATFCGDCIYSNGQYVSGYNNDGRLIGTWIGRGAQGEIVRTNYWLSPRKKIGLELRHRTIDRQFVPQGGSQSDLAVNADFLTNSGVRCSGNIQYERWQIPLLATARQSNVTVSFTFSYWPTPRQQ